MIVIGSTQELTKWDVGENPTELSTYEYSNAIVESSILRTIKQDLNNLVAVYPPTKTVSGQIPAADLEESERPNVGLAEVRKFYGFRNTSHYSKKTQRWIGYVNKIEEKKFIARLDDLTNPGVHEIGEFELSDVSPEDIKLLERGAIFYWSIGDTMTNGQLKKESIIRFKRSYNFSEDELDKITDQAQEISKRINWD